MARSVIDLVQLGIDKAMPWEYDVNPLAQFIGSYKATTNSTVMYAYLLYSYN